MNLFTELKRRNVFRVALFYIVAAWVVIQVAETLLPVFDGLILDPAFDRHRDHPAFQALEAKYSRKEPDA